MSETIPASLETESVDGPGSAEAPLRIAAKTGGSGPYELCAARQGHKRRYTKSRLKEFWVNAPRGRCAFAPIGGATEDSRSLAVCDMDLEPAREGADGPRVSSDRRSAARRLRAAAARIRPLIRAASSAGQPTAAAAPPLRRRPRPGPTEASVPRQTHVTRPPQERNRAHSLLGATRPGAGLDLVSGIDTASNVSRVRRWRL